MNLQWRHRTQLNCDVNNQTLSSFYHPEIRDLYRECWFFIDWHYNTLPDTTRCNYQIFILLLIKPQFAKSDSKASLTGRIFSHIVICFRDTYQCNLHCKKTSSFFIIRRKTATPRTSFNTNFGNYCSGLERRVLISDGL